MSVCSVPVVSGAKGNESAVVVDGHAEWVQLVREVGGCMVNAWQVPAGGVGNRDDSDFGLEGDEDSGEVGGVRSSV